MSVRGCTVTRAEKQPVDIAVIMDKVSRLGNTPFEAEEIIVELDDGVFLPMTEFNALRRAAVEKLQEAVYKKSARPSVKRIPVRKDCQAGQQQRPGVIQPVKGTPQSGTVQPVKGTPQPGAAQPVINVQVDSIPVLSEVLMHKEVSGVYLDTVTMPDAQAVKAADMVKQADRRLILCMPHIFRPGIMETFDKLMKQIPAYDGLLVRTADELAFIRDRITGKDIIGDATLYAYNTEAAACYRSYVPDMRFVFPRELSGNMLKSLCSRETSDMFICDIYGNMPVMVSAQCIQKNVAQCSRHSDRLLIKDRRNVGFDVQCVCRYCYNLIYNAIDYSLLGMAGEVMKLAPGELRLIFREEPSTLISDLIEACVMEYRQGVNPDTADLFSKYHKKTTRGHFRRGIE